ncbi:HAMP domain-containing protein [Hwanghaeella grinnelliae]|uniref:histidine kinase n=1 Tax=Hwanghaeella grinnelliae TaxID=2500179 RepID=A0A437QGH7_9PROT|nr:ATP-binding protein [Hwanghaeella grinnelliae]RVU33671.1 HAMP domain-containing protein [Hwanghaeella grinnelliae]
MTGPAKKNRKQPPRFSWLGRARHRDGGHRALRGGFWSHSLAARLIVLILLALIVSHAISFAILWDERRLAARETVRNLVADRITAVTRLVESTSPNLHDNVLAAATTRDLLFRIDSQAAVSLQESEGHIERIIQGRLAEYLDRPSENIRFAFRADWGKDRRFFDPGLDRDDQGEQRDSDEKDDDHGDDDDDHWDDDDWDHKDWDHHGWNRNRGGPGIGLRASIRLHDGNWLNVASILRPPPRNWGGPGMISFLVSAIAIIVIVTWLVRRTMRPLRDLTAAATAVGRGDRPQPVEETGPRDIRNLIAAFNTMRDRVDRFVNDRMHMLAALSHDLRTPLTTLRLRAEMLEDEEDRERFIATLDELQAMTEEVLAFIRSEAETEAAVPSDLNALAEAIVDEKAGADTTVTFVPADDPPAIRCRPIAIKRALRNLVDNAVRFGTSVEVHIETPGENVVLVILDDGPGMKEDDLDRAFDPFVRLDPARGRDTGGVGLGLSICRSIARSHGGDVRLRNRPEGGLRAELSLPR